MAVSEIELDEVSKHPRIKLKDIEMSIVGVHYFHPAEALNDPGGYPKESALWTTTICAVELENGYVVYGKSTPASAKNFNEKIGQRLAYDDAVRQVWPLMGFMLRDKLHREE